MRFSSMKWLRLFIVACAIHGPLATAKSPGDPAYDFIGDGRRLELKEGDFSIEALSGWEIYTTVPGLTLLMQAPKDKALRYQRTVQMASFSGPRYMDELTAKEFEGIIVRKFSATTSAIQNYHIRNHAKVELEDGRPGLLFYSEFRVEDVDLMQAHILVSTEKKHFLLSFTDVAPHFEGNASGPYLAEAWKSMVSARFRGDSPKRFATTSAMGLALGGLLLAGGFVWGYRWKRSSRVLGQDVIAAYDRGLEPSSQESENPGWTLPDPEKLDKRRKSLRSSFKGDDADTMGDDEAI